MELTKEVSAQLGLLVGVCALFLIILPQIRLSMSKTTRIATRAVPGQEVSTENGFLRHLAGGAQTSAATLGFVTGALHTFVTGVGAIGGGAAREMEVADSEAGLRRPGGVVSRVFEGEVVHAGKDVLAFVVVVLDHGVFATVEIRLLFLHIDGRETCEILKPNGLSHSGRFKSLKKNKEK